MAPRILLVRHGHTEWSTDGRHTGLTDIPLTERGREAARAVGRTLAGEAWHGVGSGLVLTSPLSRARETCELAGFGDRAEVCEDLREWDYGAYEGLTTAQIRQRQPGWVLWRDGVPEGATPGESPEEMCARVDRVVKRLREATADASGLEGTAVVFAHGHLLRSLAARWLGLPLMTGRNLELGPATLSVLGWAQEWPTLVRWNDASHLDG
ncbi:histidine phosphatase family protein [Allostreptomyces psammosilenae]|uniref:Putative phosphoglycerate mutase n=1 Tax=Allostreptomyces psammosilenae TaxID=1892865 RepID=A0A853A487_9ACTN|nr:histidine phosphatase family protein [Allostreptomyces psammosilenae]NYI08280.1 putative phosphoglycerate mutase [Allostreptomyces psammosilenae]